MSDRWKSELGVRLDGYNFQIPYPSRRPGVDSAPSSISGSTSRTSIISYLPDPRDTIRFGFGHTLSMPLPSLLGADVEPRAVRARLPGFRRTTTRPESAAQYCGPLANRSARNYADQLYWLTRDYRFGSSTLEAPLVGATFTNIDLSWAHEFRDGAAMKITPFYRRGYNVIEQTAQIIGFNYQTGSPVYGDVAYSNLGIQKADGIEAALHQGSSVRAFRCRSARPTSASSATSRRARSCSRRRWRWA